jgi:uncharacterized protein YcgI (DUF1989 family)
MLKDSTLRPEDARFRRVVGAGDYFLEKLHAGQTLRIVDIEGNQAADTLFYSATDPAERYSAVETIRAQKNIYLGTGTKLMSSEGRVMLEITADVVGRHDTLGGAWMLAVALNEAYGLSKRDITHNINFFMNVPVSPEGALDFEDGLSGPGKYVEMLAAMDVLVLISNCPQLNNPCSGYNPTPLEILVWDPA